MAEIKIFIWNMRRSRVDINQVEIVRALRKCGCTVQNLSAVGKGCPDILVGYNGINYLMEIKNDKANKSDKVLTPDQVGWHGLWRGHVVVIETIEEALSELS